MAISLQDGDIATLEFIYGNCTKAESKHEGAGFYYVISVNGAIEHLGGSVTTVNGEKLNISSYYALKTIADNWPGRGGKLKIQKNDRTTWICQEVVETTASSQYPLEMRRWHNGTKKFEKVPFSDGPDQGYDSPSAPVPVQEGPIEQPTPEAPPVAVGSPQTPSNGHAEVTFTDLEQIALACWDAAGRVIGAEEDNGNYLDVRYKMCFTLYNDSRRLGFTPAIIAAELAKEMLDGETVAQASVAEEEMATAASVMQEQQAQDNDLPF